MSCKGNLMVVFSRVLHPYFQANFSVIAIYKRLVNSNKDGCHWQLLPGYKVTYNQVNKKMSPSMQVRQQKKCFLHANLRNQLVTLCCSIYIFYDVQPVTKVNTAAHITCEGKDTISIKLALLQCFYLKKSLQTE